MYSKTYTSLLIVALFITMSYVPSMTFAEEIAQSDVTIIADEIITASNQQRLQASLLSLEQDTLLAIAAQRKAELMAERGEFAHTLKDQTTAWSLILNAGYSYRYAGENLAVHFRSGTAVVDAWMLSPSHRTNVLFDKYTDTGVGIALGEYNGSKGYFIVQLFASKQKQL